MDDQTRTGPIHLQAPDISLRHPPLPVWLAKRLLRPDERIAWVYGPWFSPSWERTVTNPLLCLLALALAGFCFLIGLLAGQFQPEAPVIAAMIGVAIFLASIFVVGFFSGCFTRLVVTNYRLVIIQGREICRGWSVDQLPRSLIRFVHRGGEAGKRTIDLDALHIMLGGSSDKIADSKTILSFGKHLDNIKTRENDRPSSS